MIVLVLAALVFLGTGLSIVGLGNASLKKDRAIANWPRAQGRMQSAQIVEREGRYRDQSGRESTYKTYRVAVRYEYEVNGQRYEGTNVTRSDGTWTTNRKSLAALLARHPEGPTDVLYDPTNPSVSYLEATRRSIGAVILIAFGGVFVFIGALLVAIVVLALI